MLKAIIFDRDGTLIDHHPYLGDPALVSLRPGARAALWAAKSYGLQLFLHSNQSGVSRGYITLAQAEACTRRMIDLIGMPGVVFERVCHAIELPGVKDGYRKPSPKFSQEIFEAYSLAPAEVCYIGDSQVDVDTARACGTLGIMIGPGRCCNVRADDILAAVNLAIDQ